MPLELPGAEAEPIRVTGTKEERAAAIKKLYEKPLPEPAPDIEKQAGPTGHALTLADLQAMAAANSPTLLQAAADVENARGNLIQAGLLPNPNVGYEADTVGQGKTAGQQGGYIEQTIKTAGKIRLGQAAAAADLATAQVALRRAQVDLTAKVRGAYFAVLVAQETFVVDRALVKLTDETYRLHVERVSKANLDAPYEPMALRVLALQARTNLIAAHNHYLSAWKQLAAALNALDMPPTELAGRPDMPLPKFHYDDALAHILAGGHTELLTAENGILKAQYQLRLAEVTPIPDVLARGVLQRDFTTPPFQNTVSVQIGVPLAIFDRNQGNILQARAQLGRAIQEVPRVRNDLAQRLADAFERYNNARTLLDYSRRHPARPGADLPRRLQQLPTLSRQDWYQRHRHRAKHSGDRRAKLPHGLDASLAGGHRHRRLDATRRSVRLGNRGGRADSEIGWRPVRQSNSASGGRRAAEVVAGSAI